MNTSRVRQPVTVVSDKAVVTMAAAQGHMATSRRAADRLLGYVKDVGAVIGYRLPPDTRITEIRDGDGPNGHAVHLKAPAAGFLPLQRTSIENYVEALAAYHGLEFTIEWGVPLSVVSLLPLPQTLSVAGREGLRKRMRDMLLPHVYKACRGMGKALVAQGFRVREPVPATLITHRSQVDGFAILLKYPFPHAEDKAGITEVYDRILPFMADAHARDNHLRAETLREGDATMMFFTHSHNFVPTIYETGAVIRPVIVRRSSAAASAIEAGAIARNVRRFIPTAPSFR